MKSDPNSKSNSKSNSKLNPYKQEKKSLAGRPSYRIVKVGELLQRTLSELIRELRDPRLGFLTIYEVVMSPDLRVAKVYVSILEPERVEQSIEVLNQAAGYLRNQLKPLLTFKVLPVLRFFYDSSTRDANRREKLIASVLNKQE